MSHSSEDQDADPLIQPVVEPFQKFIHAETAGGILLLGATIAAMIWATLHGPHPIRSSGTHPSVWWWGLTR